MGKIFTNDMTDKGLLSNIGKQLIQLNIKKNKNKNKNGQNWIDFSKMKMQITNRRMKRLLNIVCLSGQCKSKPQWDITSHLLE